MSFYDTNVNQRMKVGAKRGRTALNASALLVNNSRGNNGEENFNATAPINMT